MRVAVITSSYPRFKGDGTAPFVRSLCEALSKKGHDIQIVAPYDVNLTEDHFQSPSVKRFKYIYPRKWHVLGHARSLEGDAKLRPLAVILLPLFLVSAFFTLLRVTRQQSSEVIHAHWLLPNGLVAALVSDVRKIPFIISLHGSDMFVVGKNFLFRSIAKVILRKASGVSACSPDLMYSAKKLYPDLRVRLVAWGADPQVFAPLSDKKAARKELGWQDNDTVICSLGRMVDKKGFDLLVSSFGEVFNYTHREDLRLVIGGEGPNRSQLLAQTQALGIEQKVSLPGSVNWDEVPRFLAAADCFVLPSVRDRYGNLDGLPTVLLEAMACGLPCIASDIGGTSLIIQNDLNGILVEQGNRQSLVKAIKGFISDQATTRHLGENARKSVIEKFNWDGVADEFEKILYEALIKKPPARIGSQYRCQLLPNLLTLPNAKVIIDLGCHDLSWLSVIPGELKIGVDLAPKRSLGGAILVRADVNHLPFKRACTDMVYSLDLLEHLAEPGRAVRQMTRVLKEDGSFILTTPSDKIRLYPRFLADFISRKWGHHLRKGYSQQELSELFESDFDVTLHPWKALTYRKCYLYLRLLSQFFPAWAVRAVKRTVRRDLLDPWGENGFLILIGSKRGAK